MAPGEQLVAHRAAVDEDDIARAHWRGARSAGPRSPTAASPRARRRPAGRSRGNRGREPGSAGSAGRSRPSRAGLIVETGEAVAAEREAHAGLAMARRLTTSATACASARALFRNFKRAGVAANRSRTSTRAPRGSAAGLTRRPRRIRRAMRAPCGASLRAGLDFQPRHRGDRGQGFAAKAERGDIGEVAVGDFRGGVALDAERADRPGPCRRRRRSRGSGSGRRSRWPRRCAWRRRRARFRPVPSRRRPGARPPRRRRCGRREWDRAGGWS